jgi:hypothetical protein
MSRHETSLTQLGRTGLKPERQSMNLISQVEDWVAWFPEYIRKNA